LQSSRYKQNETHIDQRSFVTLHDIMYNHRNKLSAERPGVRLLAWVGYFVSQKTIRPARRPTQPTEMGTWVFPHK